MRVIDVGLREGYEYTVRDTFWTVPNVVTLLRFALIPVFVWLTATGRYLAAFWVLAVLSSTDWVDGWIARRFDMISSVGKWLDPLADRLSMIIVAATLVLTGVAPDWIVWAIVLPDLVLTVVSLLLFRGSPELEVTVLGKVRTALLLVAAPVLLLGNVPGLTDTAWGSAGTWLLSLGAVAHMLAAADYLRRFRAKAAGLRAAGIDPRERAAWADDARR
jgi:cardiolipin synthase (CMP-forming)